MNVPQPVNLDHLAPIAEAHLDLPGLDGPALSFELARDDTPEERPYVSAVARGGMAADFDVTGALAYLTNLRRHADEVQAIINQFAELDPAGGHIAKAAHHIANSRAALAAGNFKAAHDQSSRGALEWALAEHHGATPEDLTAALSAREEAAR
jgi:hypothetical protein